MTYYTTLTNVALTKISAALAAGTTLTMSEMAVGDGNGADTNPTPADAGLVNEVYRSAVNQLGVNGDGYLVAEMVIPTDVGGFSVREIALFDSDGDLFAIGKMPRIDKPLITENALGELVLRMTIAIDHASTINLTIDTALVTATQQWVEFNFNPAALFPGGTTNQVLRKASNVSGDTEWADPTQVNVAVDTIEEDQTLAAAQTVVTFTIVNTTGLAIYIDGIRLPRSAWTVNTATQITLATSYPDGSSLTAVQNEPAANLEPIKVGQIIMLGLTTLPADLFGYGTWLRVAEGRAIFGYNSGDSDHNTIGQLGGSKTHTHTGTTATAGSHDHGASTGAGGDHSHSGATGEAGLHNHVIPRDGWAESPINGPLPSPSVSGRLVVGSGSVELGETIESITHAGNDYGTSFVGTHTHSVQNSGTHAHNITAAGVHSHTITTNASNSLPPYFTVAMWQRTA
ncbi:tail fiber protein [Pararheinheimera phage vB_PsoM_KLER1-1]|nr:tail fiber protein [Pararheinheimera phage vB_PsoM_KLER1-1]